MIAIAEGVVARPMECQRLQDLVLAIAYSGDRQIDRAELVILGEYDA